jgi:DNA-binding MarR family transcriptional regulator
MFPAQWAALRFFDRAGVQACTVGGLAKYLGVTRGPASRTASSLVKRGLADTRVNPDDGRAQLFSLTEAGAEALSRDPLADLANAIEELDHDIGEQLFAALDDIYAALTSMRRAK